MSSFTHLGYPGNNPTPTLPQAPVTSSASPKSPPGSPCCETGRPIMTDPLTGQTVCSCQYGPAAASLYAGAYPRVSGLPEAFYSSAAIAQGLLPHLAIPPTAAEPSIYTGLAPPYDFKGLATAGGLYSYDPSLAAYPYAAGFLDPNARRKNATRESTQTLKAWLSEHKKNPYPTKGEKIMLAIITKMTLTQVSTWFANARRRLKKENKMTWEPRNRMDDEEDEDDIRSDDDVDEDMVKQGGHSEDKLEDENISVDSDDDDNDRTQARNFTSAALLAHANSIRASHPLMFPGKHLGDGNPLAAGSTTENGTLPSRDSVMDPTGKASIASSVSPKASTESDSPKPKIWSMAEIATSSKDSSTNSHSSNENNNNTASSTTVSSTSTLTIHSNNNNSTRPPHLSSSILASQTMHQGKIPAALSQGLHPAWRGAAHPYLHPHFAQRLAAFPGVVTAGGQTPPRHMLPAFTSLPQLRHNDGSRISAFSPPSSATSPSAQTDRNV